jgi:hypothetical protein
MLEASGMHDHVQHIALGTSLAVMVFTSFASVRAHHRHGAVDWSIVRRMAPAMVFEMVSSAQMVQSVINLMARTIGGTPPSAQQPTQQSHEVFTPTGTNPPEINQTCYVKAPEGTYRFNTVDGVKIGRNDCQAIMKGEKTLPPLTSLSIVL